MKDGTLKPVFRQVDMRPCLVCSLGFEQGTLPQLPYREITTAAGTSAAFDQMMIDTERIIVVQRDGNDEMLTVHIF